MLKDKLSNLDYEQARKHLECLYSWAEFYRYSFDNVAAEKTQLQIEDFKGRYRL